jgi:hypothetical protein
VHGACVEEIESDRFCAECADALAAAGGGVGADDFVPGIDQVRNEAAADRAACAYDEDFQCLLLPAASAEGELGAHGEDVRAAAI